MRRWPLLLGVLGLVALTSNHDPITFIQPKSRVILQHYGGSEVPVQIRIEPNKENRSYRIEWSGGASARTLDGADDAALQPPLTIRVFESEIITAAVFGPGGKLLYQKEFPLKVCGGEVACE